MIANVQSYALNGLEGVAVTVETDVSRGMPTYEIVGLPDAAVKESKERVRSAIKNSALTFPLQKITVNLAPAYVRKEGTALDLPVAISLLVAEGAVKADLGNTVFVGELALSGELRPITGVLPLIISAKEKGYTTFVVPEGNAKEASYVHGVCVYAAKSLRAVVEHLSGEKPLECVPAADFSAGAAQKGVHDLSFVKGQPMAKRALEVAVAGGHNILFVGPPGSGKTMLARSIPSVLPDMQFDEALEITKIHSVAGVLGEEGIVSVRPFRTPHHTATTVSLCGGGNKSVHPGEISLAHGGDEAALSGALAGGKAICLLAGGFGSVPKENPLLSETEKKGLLIAACPYNTPVRTYSYEYRNKLLAAACEGGLVLGAAKKSGSLITAKYLKAQGKKLFAVPYSPSVAAGEGCNALIKDGAFLTETAEDVLSQYGFAMRQKPMPALSDAESAVFKLLQELGEAHLSDIAKSSGIPIFKLTAILSSLEVKGAAVKLGGNRYAAV